VTSVLVIDDEIQIRRLLRVALEKLGYVKKGKKGREITPAGKSFLDKIANGLTRGA